MEKIIKFGFQPVINTVIRGKNDENGKKLFQSKHVYGVIEKTNNNRTVITGKVVPQTSVSNLYDVKISLTNIRFLRRSTKNCESFKRAIQVLNMSSISKVAVCQMTSVADKQSNMAVVTKLIEKACKENVQMLFFPEACDFICDNKKDIPQYAEPIIGGPTVNKYRELASKHNVWLSMGGLHEQDSKDPSKVFNTHVIIDNHGKIVQTYRKLHLFDVEIPIKNVRLKESDFCNPGQNIVAPVETPAGRIGLAICYDLRFPEMCTQLAILGAEMLTFPSAFTYATGEAHWHTLLRARAIENQCYVTAAAQVGEHNPKRKSYGHALCIDPWGKVLADCSDSLEPCYAIADISLDRLKNVRQNMPVFQHRRKDIYSLYAMKLRNKLLSEHDENNNCSGPTEETTSYTGPTFVFGHIKIPESCVFYISDMTYAFVNLRCVTAGHVLVAPKRLVPRNKDLTKEEAVDFYQAVRIVQQLMEKVHETDSCTVTIQDGPDAGQTVKHLHCHIMPRKKGDFIESDLIYLELSKHDHLQTSGHPGKPARSLQEMEAEAAMLREKLKVMLKEQD